MPLKEFDLLEYLVRNSGRVLTRGQLIDRIWGADYVGDTKTLDVHMGVDGQNFDCVRCHTTEMHNIAGRVYTRPAAKDRKSLIEDDLTPKITCESCHSATPHAAGSKANDHTDRVACAVAYWRHIHILSPRRS